jgi:hypothetical protein
VIPGHATLFVSLVNVTRCQMIGNRKHSLTVADNKKKTTLHSFLSLLNITLLSSEFQHFLFLIKQSKTTQNKDAIQ